MLFFIFFNFFHKNYILHMIFLIRFDMYAIGTVSLYKIWLIKIIYNGFKIVLCDLDMSIVLWSGSAMQKQEQLASRLVGYDSVSRVSLHRICLL